MSKETRQLPAKEFRLGSTKLSIWKNDAKGRPFYKSTFAAIYRVPADQRENGDNGWRETSSFAPEDLVLIQELARIAGVWIREQEAFPLSTESMESSHPVEE